MPLEITKKENTYELKFISGDTSKVLNMLPETYQMLEDYFKPKGKKTKQPAPAPSLEEVKAYFKAEGYQEDCAIRFHKYYSALDWFDNRGAPVLRWKGKAVSSWFKPEYKLKAEVKNTSSFFQP